MGDEGLEPDYATMQILLKYANRACLKEFATTHIEQLGSIKNEKSHA